MLEINFLICLAWIAGATIDVNLAEYQYLADHLTEGECHRLVTALHFKEFRFPDGLDAAAQKLPKDVSCVDLLLHWNSSPGEGIGETHVHICHRLNQIGREDLAVWLTRTVFRQLSNDLRNSLTSPTSPKIGRGHGTTEYSASKEIFIDEAAWWKADTFLSTVLIFELTALLSGALFYCYLRTKKECCRCNAKCNPTDR